MSRFFFLLIFGHLIACGRAVTASDCTKFARKDEGQTHFWCFVKGSGGVGGWSEEEAWYPAFTCDAGYTPKSYVGSYVEDDGLSVESHLSNCFAANGDIREPGNAQIFAIDGDGGRFGAGELGMVCDAANVGLWFWAETNDAKLVSGTKASSRKLVSCNYAGIPAGLAGVGAPFLCADGQVPVLSPDRRTPSCVETPAI